MTKRVLLTGGTGFVGANLARRLLADGHDLHLLVRPGSAQWRIADIAPECRLYDIALSDEEALMALIRTIRPEWIFHLAAHGAYASQTHLHEMVTTNIIGTINLVEACLATGFDAFVNTGSSSEYGLKGHAPAEDEWLEPNSHYALTKASATLFCRYTAQRCGVHLPTLRLYSVYGPYEEPTRLLPTLIVHGLHKRLPPLVHPEIARDFVFTEDVIAAYLLAATCHGGEAGAIYNVGSGVQTSLRAVVEIARRELGITAEPVWGSMADRQWDTSVWVANSEKIRTVAGWQPQYDFLQGFRAMVEWFHAHPALRQYYDARILHG